MREYTSIGYLGLSDREIRVLKSIFALSQKFCDNYQLVNPDKLHTADVVLVNADDPSAVHQWWKTTQQNDLAVPITLSSNEKAVAETINLKRPLQVKRFLEALQTITKSKTNTIVNRSDAQPLKALVVDDSFPVRKYMEQKLLELYTDPLNIDFSASGEEALEQISQESYDIVFLDVVMPGIDGYKVCKAIKAKLRTYVVMLTSKKSPFDRVRGAMSGCDAYITKPPTDLRLKEELKSCLTKRSKTTSKLHFSGNHIG
ncbi:MAG: response regulator [Pseudomonadota bacterium]